MQRFDTKPFYRVSPLIFLSAFLFAIALLTSGCFLTMHTAIRGTKQPVYIEAEDPPDALVTIKHRFIGDYYIRDEAIGGGTFNLPRRGDYIIQISHPAYETEEWGFRDRFAPNILYIIPFVSFPFGTAGDYASGSMHKLDIGEGQSFSLHRIEASWKASSSSPVIKRISLCESPNPTKRIPNLKLRGSDNPSRAESISYLYSNAVGVEPTRR